MSYFDQDINDDGKLYQKYLNKKVNACKEGIGCLLTYEDYCSLVRKANLVSSQLGFTGQKYVLARYNDIGDYTIENCRFITQKENWQEKRKPELERLKILSKEELGVAIKNSPKWQRYISNRRILNQIKKQEKEDLKHPSYRGSKNSQYGTYWINDGKDNKKWSNEKGSIPEGFVRGRIMKDTGVYKGKDK